MSFAIVLRRLVTAAAAFFLVLFSVPDAAAQPASRRTLQRISSEAQRTCVVQSDGTVACAGMNNSGNLGVGTFSAVVSTLTPVPGVENAVAVASGFSHTCALRANGTVLCWGTNTDGQLGDGTTTLRTSPVQVQNVTDFIDLRAAEKTTCGIRAIGEVWCWGDGSDGQLGNNSTSDSSVPVAVWNVTDAVALSVASSHACAVTSRGVAVCWGSGSNGQLGDGQLVSRTVPVLVDRLVDATDIAAGSSHTCAIRATGQVACWGQGQFGVLGSGTSDAHRTPQTVTSLTTPALRIDAGLAHTCALLVTGQVVCWGRDGSGQLGDGPGDATGFTPGIVSGLSDALDVSAGTNHSCALRASGSAVCWGSNVSRQLANDIPSGVDAPVAMSGLSSAAPVRLAAGAEHSCSTDGDGTVRCWGRNDAGQLGDGSATNRDRPYRVAGLSGVRTVAAGTRHTCASTVQGRVFCWGRNTEGQVGLDNVADQRSPVAVAGLSGVRAVAAGAAHTCALLASGGVRCWGLGTSGQLGWNSTSSSKSPVAVSGLSDAVAIAASDAFTCALRVIGEVWCWGANAQGQLGNTGSAMTVVPTNVWDVVDAVSIAAGARHACAQRDDGRTACWGDTWTGDGTGMVARRPVQVARVTNATAVSARGTTTCLRRATGEVSCWGENGVGQLGNGSTNRSHQPEEVVQAESGGAASGPNAALRAQTTAFRPQLFSGVSEVAAGGAQTCAVVAGDGVYCWGAAGLLGNGTTTQSTTPVAANAGALPVEVLFFTAVADGRSRVRLNWATASETNNAAFAVERLGSAGWTEAAHVAGRGTTSERTDYAVTADALAPGTHRFRLRQIDHDGTSTVGGEVRAEVGSGRRGVAMTRLGSTAVHVESDAALVVEVVDALGRTVRREPVEAGGAVVRLDGLTPGWYALRADRAHIAVVVR